MLYKDYFYDTKIKSDDYSKMVMIDKDDYYEQIDRLCSILNKKKYILEKKTSLASMGNIVASTNDKPIIGTMALDTCYGILLYDRNGKYGLVGHGISSSKNVTLFEMLKRMDDGTKKEVEYLIIPGYRNIDYNNYKGSEELLHIILDYKSSNMLLKPLVTPTSIKLDKNTLSYEFAFDTSKGTFVTDALFFEEIDVNPRFISKGSRRF